MEQPAALHQADLEDHRIAAALSHLEGVLIPGERLEAYAVQRRIFALSHRRQLVAATSGRFIAVSRNLFGGFHPQTFRWQDLKEARINIGVAGADLFLTFLTEGDLASAGHSLGAYSCTGLRKEQAQSEYRICQAQDQSWREKRRVRELEELRARSGGVQINSGPAVTSAAAASGEGTDPVARLQRAKSMLESGLISDAEFESLKSKIVSEL